MSTKHTFMVHDPSDMSPLGKFRSTDARYAALKVASRLARTGPARILLRKTNTKEIREFVGENKELDAPKQITRGERVITYSRRPTVKFVRRWVYDDAPVDAD